MEIRLSRRHVQASVLAAALAVCWGPGHADQRKLSGPQIKEMLEDGTVSGIQNGQAWTQDFRKGGMTVYRADGESPSEGRWRAKADQFCSQWPPARAWVCYDIIREGDGILFVPADGGDVWRAAIQPE